MIGSVLHSFELQLDRETTDRDLDAVDSVYRVPGGCFELIVDPLDRVVGSYGMLVHERREDGSVHSYELRKMYLLPELRGLGWGRRMLERGLDFARAAGASRVVLETASRLEAALRLYRAYGFVDRDECPPAARCDLSLRLDL